MPREKTRTGHHFQDRILVDIHRWTNRYYRCEEDAFPPRTAGRVVRWLEENDTFRPFMLWVDFFDPHEPWDPPEYMVRKYAPDYEGTPMLHPNYGHSDDLTPGELRNLRAHYCAEAELIDRWVGRIFQKLDDLNLWDNTIVIFTTDHGMSLGEHGRTGKSNINDNDDRYWPLYPELAHIPFMIAAPNLPGGTTVDTIAQPADILPTLIELDGLDVTPPIPFHGQSFAASLQGKPQAKPRDCAVCATHLRSDDGEVPANANTPVIYTEKWAYTPVGPDGNAELFDLDADPYAETNIIAEQPAKAKELHQRFLQWLKDIDAPKEATEIYDKQ